MKPGDLVLLRLRNGINEEPATVITLRQITYGGKTQTFIKVLWQARTHWFDSIPSIPLPNPAPEATIP